MPKLTRMDLALHADMMTSTFDGHIEAWIEGWSKAVQGKHAELKFGFPNEHTMASGAYRACWDGELEIGISPDYTFFVWRSLDDAAPKSAVRVNCDGLLHALALIHHLLQEHGIEQPITSEGNET